MAQEPRRDGTVRLPNPSAQPFVAALKTARFFAVLFFWVTMVCVLAHAATFVLTEWVGLYDPALTTLSPPKPIEPAPAEPAAPASPAAPAAPAASGPGVFETVAAAAEPGELFPNVKPEGGARKAPAAPAKEAPAVEPPAEPLPAPAQPDEGKVVGEPEEKPAPWARTPLTAEQRRLRAHDYRTLTGNVLRPARIIGTLSAMLLGVTLFLYLQIALLGRLAGIRHLTRALFMLLLFLATVLPWENCFAGLSASTLFNFEDLLEAHASRLAGAETDLWGQVLYFGRFLAMPLVSILLLAWSGIQFATGYGDSVTANE